MKYLRYFWYVLKHKWYVGIACGKEGLYWQGLVHDWHKLLPSEFIAYARYFYADGHTITTRRDKTGYWKPGETDNSAFNLAWFLHQKRAKHHWQSWIYPKDYEGKEELFVFPIPEKYLSEMICDWIGAGKAQGRKGGTEPWWKVNNCKMILHPDSRAYITKRMEE